MNQEKFIVAAFDFDGTITYHDSFIPFLLYITGRWRFTKGLLKAVPRYLAFKCGQISNQAAKEDFIRIYLSGLSKQELEELGEAFAHKVVPQMVRPEMHDRIMWHKKEGHTCVLISASLEIYLKPWAQKMGFDAVLSSKLFWDSSGKVSGRLEGNNCYGAEKVVRFKSWLKTRPIDFLYAYGDSRGDSELLELADEAYYKGKLRNNN